MVLALGKRRGPRIATVDKYVCITAIGGEEGRGRDGDVLAYHSTDGGKTWTEPTAVNDVPGSAREGLHAMAAGQNGTMYCVWLDLRHKNTEIVGAASKDAGKTWSKNVLIYRSPDGSVCECCHPGVAFDNQGNIFVMWRNSIGGARDMYVSRSADAGQTFADAAKLGQGTWPLDACPMDGGYLAISPRGEVFTAWRRDNDVFLTLPKATKEERLGAGKQPWLAATQQGPFIVWLEEGTGRLLLRTPGAGEIAGLADKAVDPMIAAQPGDEALVVVTWEESDSQRSTIRSQVIRSQ
jgi:photosystem II stability/assembly factor-like uncharacterized protein